MNILIVGLGSIATKHIIALKSLDIDIQIFGLRSNKNAEEIDGITNIYNLEDTNVIFDFAIISNPTQLHAEYISLLADKKIDLFIEKPPLSELRQAKDLIKKIAANNLKTYVACNMRFHPCISFLKENLSAEKIKKINEVNIYCGSYLPDWRPNKDFRTIYSANAEMGGGVHLDLFHELDYTHWLFGAPIKSSSIKTSKSSLHISAIDYANYALEYNHFTANIVLNYYRKDSKRTIEILFEEETWLIDLIKNKITNHKNDIIFEDTNFHIMDTYKAQMKSFISSLNPNQIQVNTFKESIKVLKICLNNE